jgi:hypothetical protein
MRSTRTFESKKPPAAPACSRCPSLPMWQRFLEAATEPAPHDRCERSVFNVSLQKSGFLPPPPTVVCDMQ